MKPLQSQAPKLDKPGAGLPFPENLIARFILMPYYSRKLSWEDADEFFARESEKILELCEPLSEAQLTTKVLVPKQRGLEDSSRYWSAAMALEHLVIVGESMLRGMLELSHERVPPLKVDTAKVKPLGELSGQQSLDKFKGFFPTVPSRLESGLGSRTAQARLPHPWFGPMNVREWHFLLAAHQGIHRRQIQAIVSGLSK